MAIASRVTKLESETGMLGQKLRDKDRVIVELEDKLSQLEQAAQEAEFRLRIMCEDNMKLAKERDSLALTAKKLDRDLAKLEKFKRQLMQSLNDEISPQAETVDIGTYDQSVPNGHPAKDDEANGFRRNHSVTGSIESTNITDNVPKQVGHRFITPSLAPKAYSTSVSPRRYSTAGSPHKTSGTTSPTTTQYGRGSLSSWYPSSQQSSAANSPPRGRMLPARTPRIDGKEFFGQARSRLSLEQFSAFLANVKELNAQRQSRDFGKSRRFLGRITKIFIYHFKGCLTAI
ncbi:Hypothetical predicted protein [Olea europaea subsp. europaea]|uniref:At4g15545-like C-terminal domain-containing protein n=1 Tax=Olea europaea subsp. europaea TaxID=158383 RepID=A0A8S0QAT1_OLEEU|nr:Hypothetical predicted protein [Olea europaea subsp. europaea]